MRPDKHKKKDFFKGDRVDYDDMIRKDSKIHQIKDDDELDELTSKGKCNLVYRSKRLSNAFDRFLRQNIGNKWDDVYSEIIKRVGHYDGIKWRVEMNAFELDGKIVSNGYCGTQEVRGFYVYNGILQEMKKSKWIRKEKKRVTFTDDLVIFKDKNIYYKAPREHILIDSYILGYKSYSPFQRHPEFVKFTQKIDRRLVKHYIEAKYIRQLSSKEIKQYELPDTDINN